MNRMIIAIPTGLIAGALVGLMIGGLWLHWQLGAGMNAGHPFVLVTEFPGLRMAGQDPWRSAYAIVLAGAVLLSLLAVAFTLTHRLTTYGTAHFQTRREIRRNGLLQPVGAGRCSASSASRTERAALSAAATTASPMPWWPRPPARARGWDT